MARREVKRPPVFVSRFGGVKASVWENKTRNGTMFNVTVTRSYKDGDTWKDSSSFSYDDLLVLAKAVNDCHTFIHGQLTKEARGTELAAG